MDLISAEYSWKDKEVLDLPVQRLRQIVANIQYRREADFRREGKLAEWQVQTISAMVASVGAKDKKHAAKLQKMLKKFTFRTSSQLEVDTGEEERWAGSPAAKPVAEMSEEELEKLLTEGDTKAADRNSPGAFNALQAGRIAR